MQKCGGCHKVKYCNQECQLAHWKAGHKMHCKEMMKAAGEEPAMPAVGKKPVRGRQQQQEEAQCFIRCEGDHSYSCVTGDGGQVEGQHRLVALLWAAEDKTNLPGFDPMRNPMFSVSHSARVAHALTASILAKWDTQKFFVRFLDGNTLNTAVANLTFVTLRDALSHLDWAVDWDMNLTKEECALVKSGDWSAGLVLA